MKGNDLTLEEKIGLIHGAAFFKNAGVERLGIPPLVMSDGPMGVRHEIGDQIWEDTGVTEDYVTYFPSNIALAATFHPELAREAGRSLGAEARGRGKDVILAPGINIMRTPLCGRNFEYMSEDPCLTAAMAVPFIEGIQENDVAACVKHFAVNNQETRRHDVNVEVDERTLREIYLPAFEACVKEAGAYAVMSAYNRFRTVYCSHSTQLLDRILREEWGFEGVVISDWAAVHDTEEAAVCGLDLEMSTDPDFDHYYMAEPLLTKVREGKIPEEYIDRKTEHILNLMEKLKIGKPDRKKGAYNHPSHRRSAKQTALESIVLLKNEGVLPLKEEKAGRIGLIGENAQRLHADGGGSAEIKALYEISPALGIQMYLGGNTRVSWAKGYSSDPKDDEQALHREAIELAGQVDTLIFIGGQNHDQDTEGQDRGNMSLPYGQEKLIQELLEIKPDMTVVLIGGSPVEMNFEPKAKAIVAMFYAGCEGGSALAEVLFGKENPSGKLPVTFPKNLRDSPAHALGAWPGTDTVIYQEGLLVGYRYFDQRGIEPLFPFGHGLSYTKFEYSGMKMEDRRILDGTVRVKTVVKNIGDTAGAEVVQLYLSFPDAQVFAPVKQLKAFHKVFLEPEEEKEVILELKERDLSYFDETAGTFLKYQGDAEVLIGASSRDIRVKGRI